MSKQNKSQLIDLVLPETNEILNLRGQSKNLLKYSHAIIPPQAISALPFTSQLIDMPIPGTCRSILIKKIWVKYIYNQLASGQSFLAFNGDITVFKGAMLAQYSLPANTETVIRLSNDLQATDVDILATVSAGARNVQVGYQPYVNSFGTPAPTLGAGDTIVLNATIAYLEVL